MNNPYNILFESVRIGPVVAPNRFYQVPHCNGFGYRMPQGMAAMREVKAEGGLPHSMRSNECNLQPAAAECIERNELTRAGHGLPECSA